MLKCFGRLGLALIIITELCIASGCGSKDKSESTTLGFTKKRQGPSGHDHKTFTPLPKATLVAELPYLVSPAGMETIPCFIHKENLVPEDADLEVKDLIEKNSNAIDKAIRKWIIEDLEPFGLSYSVASKWEIDIEFPMVLSVPIEDVRFIDNQECIEERSGWLRKDIRAVITLIGARALTFKSASPLDYELQEEIVKAVGMENIVLESPALFVYEPVVDSEGNQKIDDKGEPLFKSPDGTFVTKKKVPTPEQRLMKEWTFKVDKPIYFAFRELPKEAYHKESKKKHCNVYLVWGDVTPRRPDCDEYTESDFTAAQSGDDEVSITITTDGENIGTTIGNGKGKMVQISDRIILWISPKKIEEGVMLQLNSLVLNPKSAPGRSTRPSKDTYVPTKPAPVVKRSTPEPKPAPVEIPKKKEKPAPVEIPKKKEKPEPVEIPKKKKKDMSDEETLDAFLAE